MHTVFFSLSPHSQQSIYPVITVFFAWSSAVTFLRSWCLLANELGGPQWLLENLPPLSEDKKWHAQSGTRETRTCSAKPLFRLSPFTILLFLPWIYFFINNPKVQSSLQSAFEAFEKQTIKPSHRIVFQVPELWPEARENTNIGVRASARSSTDTLFSPRWRDESIYLISIG